MPQHPKITVGWALNGLEQAIGHLGTGRSERRVRDQLHQLMLAIERDASTSDIQREWFPARSTGTGNLRRHTTLAARAADLEEHSSDLSATVHDRP